ncbi:MAG: NADH dehydrogenase (quinone) subunit D [Bdellovibrionaceae bacterium]|nr:NADH dehydrogenase (quinone) subunit D [Pseudobdellovibrionaceae bacterium]MDW8189628.1 NADH dehydrogenase (quinone) subunit D [Pseudobdellovibrionaceae bacterium]
MSADLATLQGELRQIPFLQVDRYLFSHAFGDKTVVVPKEDIVSLLGYLKETKKYDFFVDLCGVDYPTRPQRFDVVYHLLNTTNGDRIRIKTQVGEGEGVDSIINLWRGADWFEREAYDMFGIRFNGHPNLRRILTHHQFKGHPLRKDYEANQQQSCTTTLPIHFDNEPGQPGNELNPKYVPLNIGPSHPAMHGTLRVMVELDGETIVRANCEIGYLHRCFEKMAETHPYQQVIPYTDRLNYCSAPMNNIGYCKTVEKILGVDIPPKAKAIRIILAELSRIMDHIIAIGTGGVDLGALSAFFHLFAYRERIYEIFEKLCGARLTVSLMRIGGVVNEPPPGWYDEILEFCRHMDKEIDEISRLLLDNKIFVKRTRGVLPVKAQDALAWGYTGPMLRASGVPLDLRKLTPYYGYEQLDFSVPVGSTGDIYDRYVVRIEEMRQSVKIVRQVCQNIPEGDYTIRDKSIVLPPKKEVYGNIEGLMNHFMLIMKGLRPPAGEVYDATESANGELGFYLVSDGSAAPYRLKVRPPCFAIYQSFPYVVRGGQIADAIATVASMNIIAGELDR